MKRKSLQLKELRTAILRKQQATTDKAKSENREFTPEEQTELDAQDDEIADLDAQIEVAERNEKREDRIAAMNGTSVGTGFHGAGEGSSEDREINKMEKRFSISKALRQASLGGAFDGVEKEMNDIGVAEMRSVSSDDVEIKQNSLTLPARMARAAQTVTEDNGDKGGQLVGSQPRLVDGFIPKLFLEELGATFMSGLTGNVPLPVPGAFEFD